MLNPKYHIAKLNRKFNKNKKMLEIIVKLNRKQKINHKNSSKTFVKIVMNKVKSSFNDLN